jgi:hypothetical protein
MEPIKLVQHMIIAGVAPDSEYVAAAGPGWGWVKVWATEDGYLVYCGNNAESYAAIEDKLDLDDEDELASWLEFDDVSGLDAVIHTANVRGAASVPEANESSDGPFFILETRRLYGASETSSVVMDDSLRYPLEFWSLDEARAWIKRADGEVYWLLHNEIGRPSYKAVSMTRLQNWASNEPCANCGARQTWPVIWLHDEQTHTEYMCAECDAEEADALGNGGEAL